MLIKLSIHFERWLHGIQNEYKSNVNSCVSFVDAISKLMIGFSSCLSFFLSICVFFDLIFENELLSRPVVLSISLQTEMRQSIQLC